MNTLSGVAGSGFNNSLLTQKLTDAKQQYKELSPEEQNTVQNNALDKKNEIIESRETKQDQLRSAAVQVYSNQQAKNNAELFISLSSGQEAEISQTLSASAASNVYKNVKTNTLVNSDVFQNNINNVIDNRNQLPEIPIKSVPVEEAGTPDLTQNLTELKQEYEALSPEEQNTVQNKVLDKKNEILESREAEQDQLRGTAVQVYSNQLAKDNAELFISLSTGVDTSQNQTLSASAASNVYKNVQANTLVNSDVFQNNINNVMDNRNQPVETASQVRPHNEAYSASISTLV